MIEKERNNRIGEKRTMNCGMEATIIAYRKANDLDIQFEDGTVITNQKYINFQKGLIRNQQGKSRIGESVMQKCGLFATATEYPNSQSITVAFEDGVVVDLKLYHEFLQGHIGHPDIHVQRKSVFHGFETKHAWSEENKVFYTCRCTNCGLKEIMTPQEMLAHKCNRKE